MPLDLLVNWLPKAEDNDAKIKDNCVNCFRGTRLILLRSFVEIKSDKCFFFFFSGEEEKDASTKKNVFLSNEKRS